MYRRLAERCVKLTTFTGPLYIMVESIGGVQFIPEYQIPEKGGFPAHIQVLIWGTWHTIRDTPENRGTLGIPDDWGVR